MPKVSHIHSIKLQTKRPDVALLAQQKRTTKHCQSTMVLKKKYRFPDPIPPLLNENLKAGFTNVQSEQASQVMMPTVNLETF